MDIQLAQLKRRLLERNLELVLDDTALDRLSEAGYDPVYGARPLKRAIQQQVENPLAQAILSGKFLPGDRIRAHASCQRSGIHQGIAARRARNQPRRLESSRRTAIIPARFSLGIPCLFTNTNVRIAATDDEVLQKITDKPLKKCPSCGKNGLRKLMSAPVFRLKGSGWYETDFKSDKENKRNLVGADKEEAKAEAKPDAKPDAKADAAKPEAAKTEAKERAGQARGGEGQQEREQAGAAKRAKPKPKTSAHGEAPDAPMKLAMNYARRPGIDSERCAGWRRASVTPSRPRTPNPRGSRRPAPRTGSMACPCTGCATGARRIRCSCARRAASRSKTSTATPTSISASATPARCSGIRRPPSRARSPTPAPTGITTMLPAERVARVGEKLAHLFGLPFWQMTQTATDANRAALRWARAITGRRTHAGVRWLLPRHGRGNAGARPSGHEGQGRYARACRAHRHESRCQHHHRRRAVQRSWRRSSGCWRAAAPRR